MSTVVGKENKSGAGMLKKALAVGALSTISFAFMSAVTSSALWSDGIDDPGVVSVVNNAAFSVTNAGQSPQNLSTVSSMSYDIKDFASSAAQGAFTTTSVVDSSASGDVNISYSVALPSQLGEWMKASTITVGTVADAAQCKDGGTVNVLATKDAGATTWKDGAGAAVSSLDMKGASSTAESGTTAYSQEILCFRGVNSSAPVAGTLTTTATANSAEGAVDTDTITLTVNSDPAAEASTVFTVQPTVRRGVV